MLVIRLQRTGRENLPTYRIVVAHKSDPVKGKFKEIVGHYLPSRNPSVLEFKQDRIEHWVKLGAIPSDTLARLLTRNGVSGLEKHVKKYAKKRPTKAPPEEVAPKPAPTPVAAAPVVEAPAAETPVEEAPAAEAPKEEVKAVEEPPKEEAPAAEAPAEEEPKKEEGDSAPANS